jgi:hypothetical protein
MKNALTTIGHYCSKLIICIKLIFGYETFQDDGSLVIRGEFPLPIKYSDLYQIFNTITKNRYLDVELFPINDKDTIYIGLVAYHKGTKSFLHMTDDKFVFRGTLLCYYRYFNHIKILRTSIYGDRIIDIATDDGYRFYKPIDLYVISSEPGYLVS